MAEAVRYLFPLPISISPLTLSRAGKVKYLGWSECTSESLRRACKVLQVSVVQIDYSPFTMDIEDPKIALLKSCRELGVATVAYSTLGRSLPAGQYKSNANFEQILEHFET